MRYAISELIDLPQLQQLMDSLYRATGINHALIDNDSVVHTAVGWQDICTKFHRVNPTSCARCLESDRYILAHIHEGPYVGYRCPQGLVDYATPIVIEGEHIANVFTGQMLHEPPDVEFFRRQAHDLGFDEEHYLDALAKVPVLARERMEAIMAFQVQLAEMLAHQGLIRLQRLEAARELEDFSYSVSHDLRTPLRAIAGFSQILGEEYAPELDAEGQRLLAVIRDSTAQMGCLIDNILDFIQLGQRDMERSRIDMGALLNEVIGEAQPFFASRHVRFEVGRLPPAYGDRAMLRKLLAQLLSNAVKFTRHRPEAVIEIGGASEANEIHYFVKDNGVGFDTRYADKLFKVFERVHPKGQFEGTGTGLAMVKRIADRHGGRVWAEGQVDAGAVIHFTLPRKDI